MWRRSKVSAVNVKCWSLVVSPHRPYYNLLHHINHRNFKAEQRQEMAQRLRVSKELISPAEPLTEQTVNILIQTISCQLQTDAVLWASFM